MSNQLRVFGLAALLGIPLGGLGVAQDPLPLNVAFVGEADGARAKAFVDFLKTRCKAVTAHDREKLDRKALASADVVVVDWSQKQGVMQWFGGKAKPKTSLGKRDEWRKPTVWIGSAGLNVACVWQVKGSSG